MTNHDIFSRGKYIREQIQHLPTQAQKEQSVRDLIKYILDEFVMTLATTIYLAPRIQMNFFTFRGIHGNTVQRYTNLLANDIILERGFTSVTWQPLKAIEYAKGDVRTGSTVIFNVYSSTLIKSCIVHLQCFGKPK